MKHVNTKRDVVLTLVLSFLDFTEVNHDNVSIVVDSEDEL